MSESFLIEGVLLVLLLSIRIGIALRFVPYLGGHPMPFPGWIALSLVLALAIAPYVTLNSGAILSHDAFISVIAMEAIIGLLVGILAKLAFSVFEFSGLFVGISSKTLGVHQSAGSPPIAKMYVLLGTAVFLLVDGHHALLTGLLGTVRCLPPGVFLGHAPVAFLNPEPVIGLFASALGTAVLITVPIFVASLCAELLIGLVSRMMPTGTNFQGGEVVKGVVVQVVAMAVLGTTVTVAVRFLESAMAAIELCPV